MRSPYCRMSIGYVMREKPPPLMCEIQINPWNSVSYLKSSSVLLGCAIHSQSAAVRGQTILERV